jgi:hypothetical protein
MEARTWTVKTGPREDTEDLREDFQRKVVRPDYTRIQVRLLTAV